MFDFNPEGKDAATADFGTCYDLADYLAGLQVYVAVQSPMTSGAATQVKKRVEERGRGRR